MSYTPGPWNIDPSMQSPCKILGGQYQYPIAHTHHLYVSASESEANARLIAAAPALVEALEKAIHMAGGPVYDKDGLPLTFWTMIPQEVVRELQAALALVKGEK